MIVVPCPGDGSDSAPAINAALAAAAIGKDRVVELEAGTYVVADADGDKECIKFSGSVQLRGQGRAATKIQMTPGVLGHVISIRQGARGAAVRDLGISGLGGLPGAHTLRAEGGHGLLLERLDIADSPSYGIGFQAGTFTDCTLRDILFERCAGDSLDIKNLNDNNKRVVLENLTSYGHGAAAYSDADAAFDLRGHVEARGLYAYEFGPKGTAGIRFREGENGGLSGLGAHRCNLDGFRVEPGRSNDTVALQVNAYQVAVARGWILGGLVGMVIAQQASSAEQVTVVNAGTGFHLAYMPALPTEADHAALATCYVRACGVGALVEADYCALTGFRANVCPVGVRWALGATFGSWTGGAVQNPAGGKPLDDQSGGLKVRGVAGVPDQG